MYRTSGTATSEIVLERRSRPRIGTTPGVLCAVIFIVAIADIHVTRSADIDRSVVDWMLALSFLAALVVALLVRTRRLLVTRVGREMRIRHGKKESSLLAAEVLEVEIDTQALRAHTVVFVLRDRRRIPVGEPHELMLDAVADRRALREALLR